MSELKQCAEDAEDVYDAEIAPLMTKIIAICKQHRIPMLASFQYAVDGDGNGQLCTTRIPFAAESVLMEQAKRVLFQQPAGFGLTISQGRA